MQQTFSKHTFKLITPRSIDLQFYMDSCFDIYSLFRHYKLESMLSCERNINVSLVSEFYNNLHTSDGINYHTRVAKWSLDFSYELLQSFLGCLPSESDFVFYPTLPDELPPPFKHLSIASMHQSLFGRPRLDGLNAQITTFSSLELSAENTALFKPSGAAVSHLPLYQRHHATSDAHAKSRPSVRETNLLGFPSLRVFVFLFFPVDPMEQEAVRSKGTVKWFNDTKGFGFITPDDGGEDLFVHQSSIKSDGFRSLAEGENVEYSLSEGDDGRSKAIDVTGPDGSSVQGSGGGRRDGFGGGRGGSSRGGGYGGGYGFTSGGGGGRGRGGGYGGGGSGGACYKCGETGHIAKDCYQGGGGGGNGGGGGACYNCGETGHLARDCYQGGGGGGRNGGGGGGSCYNCGETGHFARECPGRN
ncbi:hypothetical protein ZIOFF_005978 [Zingiber officinale]|uniref:Uncharacterized protein n=2 Tax=Zingiber officinale TaxID=94328 RepID=A0A8J5IAY3_ZINOF|nr:hypothetical protein ZIOFF_005978 [Zingiber officinale]